MLEMNRVVRDERLFADAAVSNTTVIYDKDEIKGNCTEIGIVKFFQVAMVNVKSIITNREMYKINSIPFNSMRKRGTVVIEDK